MKLKIELPTLITAVCLVLSSCTMNEGTPEHTTAATPLTLTESLTEEIPFVPEPTEKEEAPPKVILALYNPFSDVPKPEDSVYRELSGAVEAIADARAFLYANPTAFCMSSEYFTDYADTSISLEHNDELEYTFYPVNPEFAKTEDELFDRLRGVFTENYMSDNELRETLFAPSRYDSQPGYKTIDGTLCIKHKYDGVMASINKDEMTVLSYDENSAEVVVLGYGASDPPYYIFMTLKSSSDRVWQLDEYEQKNYFENEATLLYNAVTLNTEKLNMILGGGNTPDDPAVTEFNENTYIETDLDMTIDEMQDFFGDIFFIYRMELTFEEDEDYLNGMLLNQYRREYIDKIYYEEDGVLFRRADAPRWYLPELKIDPYNSYGEFNSASGAMEMFRENGGGFFIWKQPFCDESGEVFPADVTICYKFAENYDGYEYFYIAGDLPIMERKS